MKISVDDTLCQGHTLCARVAPTLIRLRDDDGHAVIDQPQVAPEVQDAAYRAAGACPEQAIVIET